MTDAHQVDLDEVDLLDQRWHADGPPHELFARMRSECPVHQGKSQDGRRYFSLTRDAEITAVSRDPETFSSHRDGVFLHRDQVASLDMTRNVLLYKDPPEHSKYRKILASVFTPKRVQGMEDDVRAIVTRVLDEVIEAGRCDFVDDIAVQIPLRVLAILLLGVPEDDVPKLYDWTHQIERAQQADEPRGAEDTFGEMFGYLQELVQRQLSEQGDTLVTRIQSAEVDGESLAPDEILMFFALLVFAGNDTTRNTLSTGTLALLRQDQWSTLVGNPAIIAGAVEEILRYTSVVKFFARTATAGTTLADVEIAEGDKVLTWFTSASRDTDLNADLATEDSQALDVTREDVKHRAFGGGGPHFCLGNAVARLELRVTYEELVRRMPDLALDGDPEVLRSNWAHSLTALPVTFSPRTREG